jgi:DNA-binding response OmpR family regulator
MQILEKKDVLVIDDDKSIRTLIALALIRLGLQADTAADGVAGIDFISTTSYSVVIVDLMMPRVDGAAFIDALRERELHSRVRPVVFLMTAFPVADVPVSGNDVQAVVAKPFDVMELAELVRDCVEVWRRHASRDAGKTDAPAESEEPTGPFDTN